MRLYLIDQELRLLMNRLVEETDAETGEIPEDLYADVERFLTLKEDKLLDVACALKERRVERDAVKGEAKRLAERAQRLDTQCDKLEKLLLQFIPVGHCPRDERVAVSWRKSTRVDVEVEPELLPKEYQRWTVAADKAKIGAALKIGASVDGAQLVTAENLQVK